jgi:hypothetical protein
MGSSSFLRGHGLRRLSNRQRGPQERRLRLELLEERQLLSIQSPLAAIQPPPIGQSGVSPAPLVANLALSPPTVATKASATLGTVPVTNASLSVLGADNEPGGVETNLTYTWAATTLPSGAKAPTFSVNGSANGSNAAKDATVTFSQSGAYTLTVTITDEDGLTATSFVDVTVDQTPAMITVTPASKTLPENQTQQFAATELDQFGAALSSQPTSFHWDVASGAGSVSTGGLYTPGAIGVATIAAGFASFEGFASVTVTAPNAPPTVATPPAATPNPVTGTSTNLSVLGADDGGQANLTYTWAATTVPSGAKAPTFSPNGTNAAKNTTCTFGNAGAYAFTVTITDAGGLTPTSPPSPVPVTVDQTPTKITVKPASGTLAENQTQQFTATEVDQFNNALSTQPSSFNWGVASGAGSISTGGLYTAPATAPVAGVSATVTATSALIQGSATVTVKDAAPTIATAAAANPNPVSGTNTALSVLGADDGGEPSLIYTWAATTLPSGAPAPTFSFSGSVRNGTNAAKNTTATFHQAGSYAFTVTITDAGSQTAASTVGVTVSQTLTSITISPPGANLPAAGQQQFTATGLDQFHVALATQPTFRWSTTDGMITQAGLMTAPGYAVSHGSVMAAATAPPQTLVTSHATFTVTNHAPTVATPASATPSPVTGTSTSLSVLGADDAGEANLSYTWAATTLPSGAKTPTFSVNGTNAAKNTTATFSKVGKYTFKVTIADAGGLTATSTVSVTVNQAATITVSPASVSLNPRGIQVFTAKATDQFGALLSPQPSFTWSTTAGTITKYGLLTAPNTPINGTVTASSPVGNGTTTFTMPGAISPLALTLSAPSSGSIVSGASPSLTGTNTRKTLTPADYALALTGTWLGNL